MDLLFVAVKNMKAKKIIPNWKLCSILLLSMNQEKQQAAKLRSLVKSLQSKNESCQNTVLSFYDLRSKKYLMPLKRIIHPSTLEVFCAADVNAKQLSAFSCDKYLVNDDLKKTFGILCHLVIQKLFLQDDTENIPQNIFDALRKEKLNQNEIEKIYSSAFECGKIFFNSDLGKQASSANRCESEYPFYLPLNQDEHEPIMVKGTIDLIFETNDNCIIVDFKTDQYMKPEIHQVQMDAYRLAAKSFSEFPVKIFLVYLRSREMVLVHQVFTEEKLFEAMEENLTLRKLEQGADE
jgi:hypothetical protein